MRANTGRKSQLFRGAVLSGALTLFSLGARAIPKESAADLTYVAVRGFSINAPGTAVGVVKLNASAPVNKSGLGIVVSLRSSNSSIASVPASVTIPMGKDSSTFVVTGLSAGCTGIIGTYSGRSSQADVVVHATPATSAFSLTVPNQSLYWGARYNGTFNTDGRFSGTVTLSSSNPAAATVPASIPVKTGQTSASFPITTTGIGCAIITATVQGRTVSRTSRTVQVLPLPG